MPSLICWLPQDVEKRTVVGLARYPEKKVRILEHRRRKATAVRLDTELDLYCLTPITEDGERGRIGFVGPNLSERLGQLLVQNARIVPSSEEEDVESEKMSLLQQLLESG